MTGFRPTLLLVFGPTGAGKTELAHAIARERGGEIVSADAFAVYRGLDVGTSKPSLEQRAEVPYHMLDVADPEEPFSAGRFAQEARPVVDGIVARGRLPIVCGGSGFYVAALLGGLPPGEARDPALRERLRQWGEQRGAEAAHRFLERNDPLAASRIPKANLRYTLRALEILLTTGSPASARQPEGDAWPDRFRIVKVGVRPGRAQLHARIEDRVRRMLDEGWGEEVRRLLDRALTWDSNSFQAIGYRDVGEWVLGRISREEAQERIVIATRGLARRQETWFARERDAVWLAPGEALATTLALLDGEGDSDSDRETR